MDMCTLVESLQEEKKHLKQELKALQNEHDIKHSLAEKEHKLEIGGFKFAINRMKQNAKKKGYVSIINRDVKIPVGTHVDFKLEGIELYTGDIVVCEKYDQYGIIGLEDGCPVVYLTNGDVDRLRWDYFGSGIKHVHFNALQEQYMYFKRFLYTKK